MASRSLGAVEKLQSGVVRRFEPDIGAAADASTPPRQSLLSHPMVLVWVLSVSIWSAIAFILGASEYLSDIGKSDSLASSLGVQFSDCMAYMPLTPFAYWLARRYPIQGGIWRQRTLVLLAGGVAFTLSHVILRGLTPYATWNHDMSGWVSAVAMVPGHGLQIHWRVYEHMLIVSPFEDLIFVYASIVLIGHAVAYHQSFREGELRKSQLESQLATARLEALKSQLRPHFLFNTLHSISSLMLTDVAAADQMMSLLSDLLRMSLANRGSQVTTLREELQFVDTYLEIESIRFESRLEIVREIAPETLSALVPHLLLQPLVENAVRHGVSRLASGGRIRIASSRSERDLYLRVTDNGPGFGDTRALPLRAGLGLTTTQERLRTLYSDDQQMEIRHAGEGGVDVLLRIPLTLSSPASREPGDSALIR